MQLIVALVRQRAAFAGVAAGAAVMLWVRLGILASKLGADPD